MSNKPPDDKDGLVELLKKLWLPIAGFIGAITLAYNFYKMWLGDQATVTVITAGAGLTVSVIVLCWVGFGYRTVTRDAVWPIGTKKMEKVPAYPPLFQKYARVLMSLVIIGLVLGGWALMRHKQALKEKLVILVAAFEGPEEVYGLRNEIVESLRADFLHDEEVKIVTMDDVLTLAEGNAEARKLGERLLADVVIWGWYRPTENPSITVHIENLSPLQFEAIRESETYQPHATLAQLESFEIQRKLGSETSTLINFLTALMKLKAGDYQIAKERFEQIYKANDTSTFVSQRELLFSLAITNIYLDNFDLAVQNFGEVIEINPRDGEAYSYRGTTYALFHQYERAFQDFDKAIEINPKDGVAYRNRGAILLSIAAFERALQDFDKAIEIDAQDAMTYANRGVLHQALGQSKRALQDFDKAIEISPRHANAYSLRGSAYTELGQYRRAIQDHNKALALDPQDKWAYSRRGLTYAELQQYERALQDFNKAIEIDPKFLEAYGNRGNCYSALGQYERAIQDYDKGIEIDPQSSGMYVNRGSAYSLLGWYERAIEDFDKAIQLDSTFAYAFYFRGVTYQKLNKTAEAEADFKKYEELTGEKP